MPHILVTRPIDQALRFAKDLEIAGVKSKKILIDPILRITALGVAFNFSNVRGVLITSKNALDHLPAGLDGLGLPVYCVGSATTRLACERGLAAKNMGKTAEELRKSLAEILPKGPLVHVRGSFTTIDFGSYFLDTDLKIENLITYQQTEQPLKLDTQNILQTVRGVVIPLFSTRSAQSLCKMKYSWSRHTAVAISENVAKYCKKAGFGQIIVSLQPDARSMLESIVPLMRVKSD
ncbi:MAG: uroporphyrinogen-III synthase [Planktomarina sp.]|jgi:uroporphyrinogen-III synthase|nr:uroporphyrinogen-III synthase [Planktomarina sp.]MDT2033671.1 uroporphyrinogen-III synthase [Planktomarina sp.]MDT2039862.1 uroporphyrinogen-III synthase [Planktomarina sp.]MDT2049202.1 uroporphyrinogen-III synthase [Planktomarina sp.]|tara:strand:- start:34 stop:738 length:705 start_codon:yes stop_codon:yes gene_type:complete